MPYSWLNGDRVQFGVWLQKLSIHFLAFDAPLDKFPNLIIHILPVESTTNLLDCFITTKVATCSEETVPGHLHRLQLLYVHMLAVWNLAVCQVYLSTCRPSVAWFKVSLLLLPNSCAYLPRFFSLGGTFPVVEDSSLNLVVVSALSSHAGFPSHPL